MTYNTNPNNGLEPGDCPYASWWCRYEWGNGWQVKYDPAVITCEAKKKAGYRC